MMSLWSIFGTIPIRTQPVPTPHVGVIVCAQMVFKSLTDPDTPANEGSFRPLKVLTREGTIFHAKEPAAIGFYFETEVRVYDLIWRCLAPHIPERLPAGNFGSICGTFIGGIHPDTGRQYTIIEPQIGGWGAWEGQDGNPHLLRLPRRDLQHTCGNLRGAQRALC